MKELNRNKIKPAERKDTHSRLRGLVDIRVVFWLKFYLFPAELYPELTEIHGTRRRWLHELRR